MHGRQRYNTKQKRLVLTYLHENREKHLTPKMISEALSDRVGQATVYRNLDALVQEGALVRLELPDGRGTVYQCKPERPDACRLLCSSCGRLIELDCGLVTELSDHIRQEHGFRLDQSITVFHGCCEHCG